MSVASAIVNGLDENGSLECRSPQFRFSVTLDVLQMNGKDLADLGGFESQMFHIKQWVYIFRMWVPVRRWVGFLKATLAEVLNELLKVNSKIKFRSARTSRPTVCKKR